MKLKEEDSQLTVSPDHVKEEIEGKHNASYRFFENRKCEFYPCHKTDIEQFNCLFCFCPLYYAICLGEPQYIQLNGSLVKDCSKCDYPHRTENYTELVEYLKLSLE